MLVTPAKSNLQHEVQIGDSAVTLNQQAAPDHWGDLAYPYMLFVDLEARHSSFHDAASLDSRSHYVTLSPRFDPLSLNQPSIARLRVREYACELRFIQPIHAREQPAKHGAIFVQNRIVEILK